MKNPSLERAFSANPPLSLSELKSLASFPFALKCYLPTCPECDSFERDGRRKEFERDVLGRDMLVIPWDCSLEAQRKLAMKAKVENLPSYIVVKDKNVEVKEPS